MNIKAVEELIKIANTLDNTGYYKEANMLTKVMIKVADEFNMPQETYFDNDEEENTREDTCPNCGNGDERLASDPSVIVMGKFSNGKVAWCENNNCSYNYWQDAIDGVKQPKCPICDGNSFYFRNDREPFENFTCANERCNAEFMDGEEVRR